MSKKSKKPNKNQGQFNPKRREFVKKGATIAGSAMTLGNLPYASRAEVLEDEVFDFIVVGSGAGGGPLAVRLATENGRNYTVLLIEAGNDQLPDVAKVPALHALSAESPEMTWDFFVKHYDDPNAHGKFQHDRGGVLYPRTSVVGGCTAHNAMIALYPDSEDWNNIFRKTGGQDPTWKADKMYDLWIQNIENATYLKRSLTGEQYRGRGYNRKVLKGKNLPFRRRGWHNLEMSPLSLLSEDPLLSRIVFGAARHVGLGSVLQNALENDVQDSLNLDSYLDANHPRHIDEEGFFRIPKSTRLGHRYGVYEYVMECEQLTKVNSRQAGKNLVLAANTLVEKVEMADAGNGKKKAMAVHVLEGSNIYQACKIKSKGMWKKKRYVARKEIILAGGAFNSPQLLMLSGIGDPEHLKQHNIKTEIPLVNVGKNLQDRYEATVVTELNGDLKLIEDCQFQDDFKQFEINKKKGEEDLCLKEWMNQATRNKSLYASNGAVAAIRKKSSVSQDKKNDLIIFGVPGDFKGYKPKYAREDAVAHKNRFTWAVLKGHSRNRSGEVKLKNNDPKSTPDIHFKYFTDGGDEDLQAVYEGVKYIREMNDKLYPQKSDLYDSPDDQMLIPPMEDIATQTAKEEIYPGKKFQTEDQLKGWIQREAWGHHASCSNKMGEKGDMSSVVDGDFKVQGTTNLRIVDASVFPEIPGLFIVVPIYMISEKAAKVIIAAHS